jgi:hypothetical protein
MMAHTKVEVEHAFRNELALLRSSVSGRSAIILWSSESQLHEKLTFASGKFSRAHPS